MGKKVKGGAKAAVELLKRTRKSNYSDAQRAQILMDARDNALDWAADLIHDRDARGTAAAIHCYEQMSTQLGDVQPVGAAADTSIPGLDSTQFVFMEGVKPSTLAKPELQN